MGGLVGGSLGGPSMVAFAFYVFCVGDVFYGGLWVLYIG